MRRFLVPLRLCLLLLLLPQGGTAATWWASPTGSGNGQSPSSPFRIHNFWSVVTPGDTLWLLDGTYTGAQNMLTPPAGLSGNSSGRIMIKALNDGAVHIDGQWLNEALYLNNNHWFQIEGINFSRGLGSTLTIQNSSNTILRRVCGWDAHPAPPIGTQHNQHTFLTGGGMRGRTICMRTSASLAMAAITTSMVTQPGSGMSCAVCG